MQLAMAVLSYQVDLSNDKECDDGRAAPLPSSWQRCGRIVKLNIMYQTLYECMTLEANRLNSDKSDKSAGV